MARSIQVQIVGDARSLERAFGRASRAGSKFGSAMRTIGKVAVAGFGAAVLGFGVALKRGFSELAEAQKVAAQTNAVLRSTGGIANVTAKHVDKLASRISRKSGIDDEAIASAENLLLTFTNIRNGVRKGNKVFDQATRATVDMATALGMDLNSAAMMVGKALNQMDVTTQGNVRGFMALRRVGVQISPAMMAQARAFIEANKPMEAQKLLLRELQTEFGGSAAAFGTTMPGALGKLRNAFDEVAAAFASGFLPLIQRVAKVLTQKLADPAFVARVRELGTLVGTKLFNAFQAVGQWFQQNWPAIRNGFEKAGNLAKRFHGWLQKVSEVLPGGGQTLVGVILGGVLVAKMLAVASALKLINGRLLIMAARFAPVLAAMLAVQKFQEHGLTGKPEGNPGWKGWIPGYGLVAGRTGPGGDPKPPPKVPKSKLRGYPRASGGPVMPGVRYMVGERGPEMFVPGLPGTIVPNGGGIHIAGDLHLHGVQNVRQLVGEIQRQAKRGAAQTRGRHPGLNLGFS